MKSGWKVILVVVTPKLDKYENQRMTSEQQLENLCYHQISSFSEMNTLAFQEHLSRSVCANDQSKHIVLYHYLFKY